MNAPLSVIILPVPVGTGDNGVWKKALNRRHKAIRPTERWRPSERIPQLDRDRLRRLVEQFRDAVRVQHEALLAAGRSMLQAMQVA
jgi:hypothetical protein